MLPRKYSLNDISKILESIGCKNTLNQFVKLAPTQINEVYECLIYLSKFILQMNPNQIIKQIQPDNIHLIDARAHEEAIINGNQFSAIRPLLQQLNINMEYSDYYTGNIQVIYDALEELVKYKNFHDSINRENKIHNLDFELKKSAQMVIKTKKSRQDQQMYYLHLQAKKAQQRPYYNDLMFKKSETQKRFDLLQYKKKQATLKKIQIQNSLNGLIEEKKSKLRQHQQGRQANAQIRKKIALNIFSTQQQLYKTRQESQKHRISHYSQVRQYNQKRDKINEMYQSIKEFVQEYNTQAQNYQNEGNKHLQENQTLTNQRSKIQQYEKTAQYFQNQILKNQQIQDEQLKKLQQLQSDYKNQISKGKECQTIKQHLQGTNQTYNQYIKNMTDVLNDIREQERKKLNDLEIFKRSICDRITELQTRRNKYVQHKFDRLKQLTEKYTKVFRDIERRDKQSQYLSLEEETQIIQNKAAYEALIRNNRPLTKYAKQNYVYAIDVLPKTNLDEESIQNYLRSNRKKQVKVQQSQKVPQVTQEQMKFESKSIDEQSIPSSLCKSQIQENKPVVRQVKQSKSEIQPRKINLFGVQKTKSGNVPNFLSSILPKFMSKESEVRKQSMID